MFPRPVVELTWEINGSIIERYFYGYQRGLVGWRQEEWGWRSYLVEEYLDRPPMDSPAWPVCHPRPWAGIMYYRGVVPIPPPVPPPPEPECQPMLVVGRYGLNIRADSIITAERVGYLRKGSWFIPDERRVIGSDIWVRAGGLGWLAQLHNGVTYLVPFGVEQDQSRDE